MYSMSKLLDTYLNTKFKNTEIVVEVIEVTFREWYGWDNYRVRFHIESNNTYHFIVMSAIDQFKYTYDVDSGEVTHIEKLYESKNEAGHHRVDVNRMHNETMEFINNHYNDIYVLVQLRDYIFKNCKNRRNLKINGKWVDGTISNLNILLLGSVL